MYYVLFLAVFFVGVLCTSISYINKNTHILVKVSKKKLNELNNTINN